METLNHFIQCVGRAFYSPEEVVVLDALVYNRECVFGHGSVVAQSDRSHAAASRRMMDDQLANLLQLPARHVRRVLGNLVKQRLIRHQLRSEKRENVTYQPPPRDYYFIDYRQFVAVVKHKISHIVERLREMLKTDEAEGMYNLCNACGRKFPTIEALRYMNPLTFTFECPFDRVCARLRASVPVTQPRPLRRWS